ncbi:MAG: transporter [Candidatus Eremiobacteraeota bacterium]|nr:transporter [Candidatus Eremiobacteraeota bacterium]
MLTLMTTAQAGASVVQQALGSLSPILVATFVLSKAQLGVIFTALMLGSALFVATSGVLTDRWGERRMVLLSGLAMTLSLLAASLVGNYPALVACIALFGAAYAASTPAGGRAILAWFDRDRGFAMGIRQTGVPVGGVLGALTLPFIAHAAGYRVAFVFAAAIVAITTFIAVGWYREAGGARSESMSLASIARGMRTLARDPRLIGVTLTCMTLVSVQLAMNAFVTVTGVAIVGTSPGVAALAFACAQGGAVAGRLVWGFISDRVLQGERLVPFAIICVLAALATAALAMLRPGAVAPAVRRGDRARIQRRRLERAHGGGARRGRRRRTRRQRARPGAHRDLPDVVDRTDRVRGARRPRVAARGLAGDVGARLGRHDTRPLATGAPRGRRKVRHPHGLNLGRSAPRWRNW